MAFLLEMQGTANAVKTAIGAVTGANAQETTMLGVAIPMLINQINNIGGTVLLRVLCWHVSGANRTTPDHDSHSAQSGAHGRQLPAGGWTSAGQLGFG